MVTVNAPADTPARVLLVEDDETLRTVVADALRDNGYVVATLADGERVLEVVSGHRPDLAILDVMLPGRSGFELARVLRGEADIPVVFVTARDGVDDRLTGFDLGADDYLVKPFELAELLARVRAVLRRSGRLSASVIQVSDLVVDEDAGVVVRAGRPVDLTATELRLLTYLARNRGRVLSKTQILTQVWGYDAYDPNLVEAFVSGLRRKMEVHGDRLIHTVRGIGYRLSAPPGAPSS
ncbi:response regulator transcription factor [Nakamurella flavida]